MGKAVVTLRYRAQTTAAGYRRLEQALLDMGLLYNAVVAQRGAATSTHRRRQTGRDITELQQHQPYCGYTHRLLTEVERQVNDAFGAYYDSRKDDLDGPKRSRPRTKDPHRNRTVTISEPATNHLEVTRPRSGRPPGVAATATRSPRGRSDHPALTASSSPTFAQ